MKVAAITGATGAIGPIAAAEFAAAGFTVRALSREAADVCDGDALRRAFSGADCVLHLAAKLHLVDPPPSLRDEYRRVNVGGTEQVIRAAEAEGVRRVVHVSTIAVYGYDDQRLLTEESETRPETLYGLTKRESEHIALASNAVVLRFAAVYGARVKGNYRKLLLAMNRGRFLPLGSGRNRRTLVYDRDAARAAVLAATHPAAPGQVFNVTDGSVHTVREIVAAMADALGRRVPRIALPVAPIKLAAGAVELAARLTGTTPRVTRSMIAKYVEDVTVSGEKIRKVLGFEPGYDLQCGWRETVALMREAGEL
jgi:nucleoside-diphosphate-sugar epimerase